MIKLSWSKNWTTIGQLTHAFTSCTSMLKIVQVAHFQFDALRADVLLVPPRAHLAHLEPGTHRRYPIFGISQIAKFTRNQTYENVGVSIIWYFLSLFLTASAKIVTRPIFSILWLNVYSLTCIIIRKYNLTILAFLACYKLTTFLWLRILGSLIHVWYIIAFVQYIC